MGRVATQAAGIESRSRAINEAVRTELLLSYSSQGCAASGQLPNVGSATAPQGRADGFSLKSTMYLATAVKGNAKPVLVLFKTDTPRVAQPIVVCNPTEIDVDQTAGAQLIDCCGGSMTSVMLTFSSDVSGDYAAEDLAIYRTGMLGASYAVEVTGVSGAVVNIVASDGVTILPCCAGGKDTYGTQGELISLEGVTARSSEIMKASCTGGVLTIELFDPIVGGANNDPATITLQDGTVVNVTLTATIGANVVYTVDAAGGETCDICDLDCACLVNAVFNIPA